MKNKLRGGFSYIEILIALALFAIMLMAVLPMVLQAGRNMRFAESNYRYHLMAQGMMLVVRDALLDGVTPQSSQGAALGYASDNGVEFYRVWIFGESVTQFGVYGTPEVNVSLTGGVTPSAGDSYVVIAAIWNENGDMAGRAVGVALPGLEGEHEIP